MTPEVVTPAPVAVVVVTWNSERDIDACLRSAFAERPAEVVVVDNASQDRTLDIIAERFPETRVMRMNENTGFAAGCNTGVAASSAPYVLFLNADATMEPGYLATLVAALDAAPSAASAIGKLVYEKDGQRYIDSAGIELVRYALRPGDRGYGELDRGQYDEAQDIFGPSGAAAMYRRRAFESVGAFDEEFFAYYEDVDLAWRLTNKGWRHLYVPSAVCDHERRGAKDKPREIAERAFVNRYMVWIKNESLAKFVRYAPVAVPWEVARVVRKLTLKVAARSAVAVWRRVGR